MDMKELLTSAATPAAEAAFSALLIAESEVAESLDQTQATSLAIQLRTKAVQSLVGALRSQMDAYTAGVQDCASVVESHKAELASAFSEIDNMANQYKAAVSQMEVMEREVLWLSKKWVNASKSLEQIKQKAALQQARGEEMRSALEAAGQTTVI